MESAAHAGPLSAVHRPVEPAGQTPPQSWPLAAVRGSTCRRLPPRSGRAALANETLHAGTLLGRRLQRHAVYLACGLRGDVAVQHVVQERLGVALARVAVTAAARGLQAHALARG